MNKIFKFKLTILVTILILIGILMPGDSVPSVGIPGMDKIVHFGMFFTFTATFYLEYLLGYKKLPQALYVVIGVACFAISTEIMQLFAANRSFDLKDFVVDMVGCVVAIGLWIGIMKYKESR
ncbi:MAG: VanZ family protein [Cellulosilyticaceae bacterium]